MKRYNRKLLKHAPAFLLTVVIVLCAFGAHAGNIDPDTTGCKYAWSENAGWINFNPSQGPGVTVTDTTVTGMAWGENIGWINLSPANGGVVNDGIGNLSGYAWAENVGWIKFNPVGGGVSIGSDGKFTGYAWGENIGWINFGASNSCVKTAWLAPPHYTGTVTTGTNIPVVLGPQIDLTLSNVVSGGSVTAILIAPGDVSAPANFKILDGSAFDITTNATYNGQIRVCIGYDPALLGGTSEQDLKLFHFVGGNWQDITQLPVDTTNKKVCGQTSSFSVFGVAAPLTIPPTASFTWRTAATADYKILFDASSSVCPSGATCTYTWSTGETGVTASHVFPDSTTTTVTLTVTASTGSSSASKAVTPKYVAATPTSLGAGLTVTPNGFSPAVNWNVTGGVAPYKVRVNWGDGTTIPLTQAAVGPGTLSHTYVTARTYTVSVYVIDSGVNGSNQTSATATASIVIAPSSITVSGLVTRSNGTTPVSAVAMTLKQGTVVKKLAYTDASGNYTMTGVAAGSYTLTATRSGYTFPAPVAVTVGAVPVTVNISSTTP
jgi:hypothetical protein